MSVGFNVADPPLSRAGSLPQVQVAQRGVIIAGRPVSKAPLIRAAFWYL